MAECCWSIWVAEAARSRSSEHKRIKETISVPLGAVRLTEQFLQADPPPREGLTQMRRLIARELRRAHRRIQPSNVSLGDCDLRHRRRADRGVCGSGKMRKAGGEDGAESIFRAGTFDWLPGLPRLPKYASWLTDCQDDVAGARGGCRASGRGGQRSLWPARKYLPNCWRALGWRGIPLLAAGAARRHPGADAGRAGRAREQGIVSLSMSAGRACWRPRDAMALTRDRQSRCARMPCSFSAN